MRRKGSRFGKPVGATSIVLSTQLNIVSTTTLFGNGAPVTPKPTLAPDSAPGANAASYVARMPGMEIES